MKKYVINSVVLCFVFSFSVLANVLNDSAPKLSIISISLPPLQYFNPDNQLEGYFVEVIKAAMATTDFPYHMDLYPWARSYHLAQHQKNVCIFSLNRIPERESLFKWVAQLAKTHSAVYSLKNRGINISSLEEAKEHYKGVAIRDGVYHQLLMRHGFEENKNVYVVSDSNILIKLFYTQRQIDFILSDDIVLNRLATRLNINTDAFQRQFYLDTEPLRDYIACSPKTSDDVILKLQQAFDTIKHNGTLSKINDKWRDKLGSTIID